MNRRAVGGTSGRSTGRSTARSTGRSSVAAALALALVLASCAIGADDEPRDIGPLGPADTIAPDDQVGDAATGSDRIFLLAPEVPGLRSRLTAVARDAPDDPSALLATLLAGPNPTEREEQLRTALPDGLRALDVEMRGGGEVRIDLSPEILQLSGDGLIAALAQIVFTVTGVAGIDAVLLTVEGASVQWPSASGELTGRALTVYDYPGWESSSQPAYPGAPIDA